MDLARCLVSSWCADFAKHGDSWRILEVKLTEDPNRVHRVQNGGLTRIVEGIRQIKTLHAWVIVWRVQANDFRVLGSGLRQQIFVRGNYIGNPHIRTIRETAWSHDMPFDINRVLVIGNDRVDSNSITVVN